MFDVGEVTVSLWFFPWFLQKGAPHVRRNTSCARKKRSPLRRRLHLFSLGTRQNPFGKMLKNVPPLPFMMVSQHTVGVPPKSSILIDFHRFIYDSYGFH